jgi:hypothetical protein
MPALPKALLEYQGRSEIEAGLLPEDTKLGPAMTILMPKARAFVLAIVEMGGALNEMHVAAERAGYKGDKPTLYVQAHRLAADPRIQTAILEEARARCKSASLLSVSSMIEIIQDKTVKPSTRLQAASRIAAIAGMDPATQMLIKTTSEVTVTVREQISQVRQLAKDLGLDPKVLLGKAGVTLEGEFEEVGLTKGLEDLL